MQVMKVIERIEFGAVKMPKITKIMTLEKLKYEYRPKMDSGIILMV